MWGCLALILVASAAPPKEDRQTVLGFSAGLGISQFRDQQVTPLRVVGAGPGFGLSIDVIAPSKLDRTSLVVHLGGGDGWRWQGAEYDGVLAPRVYGTGDEGIFVGPKFDLGLERRSWIQTTWHGQATVGLALGARTKLLDRNRHKLLVEAALSTPLIGVVARPGFANTFQENSLSGQDFVFASLHNHLGLDGTASILWLRPSGSHLRLELRSLDQRIAWRHRFTRSIGDLRVVAYWRL